MNSVREWLVLFFFFFAILHSIKKTSLLLPPAGFCSFGKSILLLLQMFNQLVWLFCPCIFGKFTAICRMFLVFFKWRLDCALWKLGWLLDELSTQLYNVCEKTSCCPLVIEFWYSPSTFLFFLPPITLNCYGANCTKTVTERLHLWLGWDCLQGDGRP